MATKGKTVGVWLPGEALDALAEALRDNPNMKEGTYCAEAVQERLRNEGYLRDTPTSQIAAKALELAKVIGSEELEKELEAIASRRLAVVAP